jgi:hypothetical protein
MKGPGLKRESGSAVERVRKRHTAVEGSTLHCPNSRAVHRGFGEGLAGNAGAAVVSDEFVVEPDLVRAV